jgi:hypothetical protein
VVEQTEHHPALMATMSSAVLTCAMLVATRLPSQQDDEERLEESEHRHIS